MLAPDAQPDMDDPFWTAEQLRTPLRRQSAQDTPAAPAVEGFYESMSILLRKKDALGSIEAIIEALRQRFQNFAFLSRGHALPCFQYSTVDQYIMSTVHHVTFLANGVGQTNRNQSSSGMRLARILDRQCGSCGVRTIGVSYSSRQHRECRIQRTHAVHHAIM